MSQIEKWKTLVEILQYHQKVMLTLWSVLEKGAQINENEIQETPEAQEKKEDLFLVLQNILKTVIGGFVSLTKNMQNGIWL